MKKLLSLLLLSLASGQQMLDNNNTSNISNSSLSFQTSVVPSIALNDKKVEVNVTINRSDEEGTAGNPFDPPALIEIDDQSLGSFKYYFVILGVSSLSVIIFIIFKALRLRKSRAEIKYGKAGTSDRSEFEPLGKSNNKWLEESDDDNEDEEIFDINFLKNSRTNLKA